MQLIAEKEILIVVASLVQLRGTLIVASQLYDVADVQFTEVKEDPLNFCNLFKSITLGALFQI